MSSSPQFRESSPVLGLGSRTSQFTYRHLSQLASFSPSSPLRVVAHIDLDAFYAQCEMVRLGTAEDQPLAVQQWQGLIAINYPARSFGIGRHCNLAEAKKLCPELIAQHVATWREGDDKWAYREDSAANITSDKVSLDPYRLQSRKILQVIKETLPSDLQKVEKASIDEVFCDLSAHIHHILLQRYPELAGPPPYDDPTERLPRPPVVALDWKADALVDLDEEGESEDPDWDDVAILIGSEIIRDVRSQIRDQLHYTCSAGIANNKMLSKLGSAYKKPNQQTVIRNRAVEHFLSDFKFTKIRNLGGKLGEHVVSTFGTETIRDVLPVALDQMKAKLGDDTGTWVYNTIRGIDQSEVSSRTQIKSMLSAKSFRPTITSIEQAVRWLRIFAADIFARLVEEGVLENKRRPKTINLHHRHGGQMKSRQAPISQGKPLDERGLFDLAKNLLNQIIAEGNVWPCANLSLSVGGFEDGIVGNMSIGAFLVRGEEAQALKSGARDSHSPSVPDGQSSKKRRVDGGGTATAANGGGIHRFLKKKTASHHDDASSVSRGGDDTRHEDVPATNDIPAGLEEESGWAAEETITALETQAAAAPFSCTRCDARFDWQEDLQSHQDWHFAKDLQDEERGQQSLAPRQSAPFRTAVQKNSTPSSSSKQGGRRSKTEHGQQKLTFGGP